MKILVFGNAGQLGKPLFDALSKDNKHIVVGINRSHCDVLVFEQVEAILNLHQPDLIINCIAYTDVDKAEQEVILSYQVNAMFVEVIANWAKNNNSVIIHFSTNYVYDGTKDINEPYYETDEANPINIYGKTKLQGELLLHTTSLKSITIRTSGIHSGNNSNKNFVNTIVKALQVKETLAVINDTRINPTHVDTLVDGTIAVINSISNPDFNEWGVYHLADIDTLSWHQYSQCIFNFMRSYETKVTVKSVDDILPVSSAAFPTIATRPQNSTIDSANFKNVFGIELQSGVLGIHKSVAGLNTNAGN